MSITLSVLGLIAGLGSIAYTRHAHLQATRQLDETARTKIEFSGERLTLDDDYLYVSARIQNTSRHAVHLRWAQATANPSRHGTLDFQRRVGFKWDSPMGEPSKKVSLQPREISYITGRIPRFSVVASAPFHIEVLTEGEESFAVSLPLTHGAYRPYGPPDVDTDPTST